MEKVKIRTLTEGERVGVWVSKETKKKLMLRKIREGVNSLDTLIVNLLKD